MYWGIYGIIPQLMDMSGEMLVGCAVKEPHVRYSAAYPTGVERIESLNHEIR